MIIGRGHIKEPGSVTVSIQIEMKLAELIQCKDEIERATGGGKYPLYQLMGVFSEVIRKAEKEFYVNENDLAAASAGSIK